MIYSFIQGFLFSLSLCLDLGMVNVAIIKAGVERGFKHSFLIGFGSCFGDLFYLTLALIGFTAIFQISYVRWILWIVGTIVLFYLTLKMIKGAINPQEITSGTEVIHRSGMKDFIFGIGVAISSPTVILWFAVVTGAIVAEINKFERMTLISFVIGFFVAGLLWSLGLAMLSSKAGKILGKNYIRAISLVSAIIFLYFAVKVFMDGLRTIIKM
ncbi:LysE family translocator [Cohnella laeviribosi]|uniref:LysE family translocator n=1 Tax=Cohnella laeviribosi TaxID=380174 RepID=UPI00035CDBEE|nr:LysE family transporter [Cohnella laeviribosi]